MYSRIIVGFDDSEGGKDAVALGRPLADRAGAELVIAGALPDTAARRVGTAPLGGFERDSDQRFADAVSRTAAEVDARPELVSGGVGKDAPYPVLVVPRGDVEVEHAPPIDAAAGVV